MISRTDFEHWKRQIYEELDELAKRAQATTEERDAFRKGVYNALREMTGTLMLQGHRSADPAAYRGDGLE